MKVPAQKVLAVIATYNEAGNIAELIGKIREQGCDVLVVDDNSPDGTGSIVEAMREQDPGVHVIHRSGKLGLGSACIAGFRFALDHGYDLVVEMDGDFSHDPSHLDAILGEARAHPDSIVIGSRYVKGGRISGWGWHRKLLSLGASWYLRVLLGVGIHDYTSGYRCYSREALSRIGLSRVLAQGYAFLPEMAYRASSNGVSMREVPIHFRDRKIGESKVGLHEVVQSLLVPWRIRFVQSKNGPQEAWRAESVAAPHRKP